MTGNPLSAKEMAPQLALKRIDAAEDSLRLACSTQSLLRIHEQIDRAGRQLEAAKAILRAAAGFPIT